MTGRASAQKICAEARFFVRFRGESDIYTWLCRIAKNRLISHLRREKHQADNTLLELLEAPEAPVAPQIGAEPLKQVKRSFRRGHKIAGCIGGSVVPLIAAIIVLNLRTIAYSYQNIADQIEVVYGKEHHWTVYLQQLRYASPNSPQWSVIWSSDQIPAQ